jgi:hypothetical protein
MEMVKSFTIALALVSSLVLAGDAQAFGHRRGGCSSCGGCPGGNCSVPYYAPSKQAAVTNAPPGAYASAPAAEATVAQPAQPQASNNYVARRGLFGRR